MSPNSGTVAPTFQEQELSRIATQQFQDYQSRWLPVQQHLNDVVDQMGKPDSWQRAEAEGKGAEDVASQFEQANQRRTAQQMDRGINVGSGAFNLGITGSAAAQAASKGAAVAQGNEAIDKAYFENLSQIAQSGQTVANQATRGMSVGAEIASREAISSAQASNATASNVLGAAGFGIGALSSPSAMRQIGGIFGGSGGPDISTADMNNPAIIASGATP